MAVCRDQDIPEGRGRSFDVAGLCVAILRHGGSVTALSDRCPHAGGSLGQGWVE
ncbi:MAG: Rieske 2Fe-2S domain-containing protein, partial [Acetobacteraceae bacterium]|nr:Rieske 2Fe-2S domain-containing protein [Acetobacteraceae bacterium]